jgi:hypothetical protein
MKRNRAGHDMLVDQVTVTTAVSRYRLVCSAQSNRYDRGQQDEQGKEQMVSHEPALHWAAVAKGYDKNELQKGQSH